MNNSYWISTIKKNRKLYPKLQEEKEAEITIIGGGLTGLTTAYYLSKACKKVIILEKYRICNHTSGNTTGKITSEHGLFYNYLLQSLGKDKAQQYLLANEQAIDNIENIIKEENIECEFEKQDSYVFSQTGETFEKLKKEQQALEYIGFKNSELVDNIELPIKDKEKGVNKKVLGALKFKEQAQFNPCLYGIALAQKIEENKGKIYENSKVVDVKKRNNEYEIITEEGKIKSKIVVIATHFPIVDIPGFYFIKMYQETSYLIAVETNERIFNGMYISAEDDSISFRSAKYGDKRLVIIGGSSHKTGAKIDLQNSYKKLEEIANEIYPGSKVLYKWNAQDCISLDKIPYIGEFSNLWSNVYLCDI